MHRLADMGAGVLETNVAEPDRWFHEGEAGFAG